MYDDGEAGADIEDPYYNEYDVDHVENLFESVFVR